MPEVHPAVTMQHSCRIINKYLNQNAVGSFSNDSKTENAFMSDCSVNLVLKARKLSGIWNFFED
jgi:hypothetical protein